MLVLNNMIEPNDKLAKITLIVQQIIGWIWVSKLDIFHLLLLRYYQQGNIYQPHQYNHISHDLSPQSRKSRLDFCQGILHQSEIYSCFMKHFVTIAETPFRRKGRFNTRSLFAMDHDAEFSINQWVAVAGNILIGPQEFSKRVNAFQYLALLRNGLLVLPENHEVDTDRSWILLNRAPLHRNQFHIEEINNVCELRQQVRHVFNKVTPKMLKDVSANFYVRLHLCIQNDGEHFEHVLF
ncbi:hypothetical protein QAD02_022517 [Eretmocerus hayati]|uniref:Uncharacterized protein n=1 Tax=Eretmocerus hayati TaxID=131215 RepID=A0ACC2PTB0_9HYME|nr:hypothetical protein QAD02_022517 [Eretmocerus hayati]